MSLKKRLAREIVTQLYSEKEAKEAEAHFEKTVQKKELPDEIQEFKVPDAISLSRLLVKAGLVASRSEANRLIQQGAVTVDGYKVSDANKAVTGGLTIKVGKRRYLKTP